MAVCHHISSSAGYTDRKPCLSGVALELKLCGRHRSVVRLPILAVALTARAELRKHNVAVVAAVVAVLGARLRSGSTKVAVDAAGMSRLGLQAAAVVGNRPRMVTAA